jgi:squalene synthase HpnC
MNPLQEAYALCRAKAFGHYENFPVASLLLPPAARDAVAAVYAFARQADDFADEPEFGPAENRLALLRAWQANLDHKPKIPEFLALQDACDKHQIPEQLLRDLIAAFVQDCKKSRYKNFKEVLAYCSKSANPVGRLVLRITGRDDAAALAESDAICTALQLANFWQDLASDAQKRDRVYLPADEMKRFGVGVEQLRAGSFGPKLANLMRFQVDRTEALFKAGEGLPARLGGRLGAEIRLTLLGGRRILEKIRFQGYNTLARRPKLGAADAPALLWRFATGSLG